jgi:hypothetical protein
VGSLRFESVTNNNQLNRVFVSDNSGNVFWRDAASLAPQQPNNSWLTTGNNGIASGNFLGTIANQRLNFRTNNVTRMFVSEQATILNRAASRVQVGLPEDSTNYTNLFVYSRDIPGLSVPMFISCNIAGSQFSAAPPTNNNPNPTLGRLIRLNQGNTNNNGGTNFYDIGITNLQSLYFTGRQVPGSLTGLPLKAFTIASNNNVGFNLPWNVEPSANLHNRGSVRLQGLQQGSGNVLVVDDNGNVFRSQSTSFKESFSSDIKNEIELLKAEISEMKKLIEQLKKQSCTHIVVKP